GHRRGRDRQVGILLLRGGDPRGIVLLDAAHPEQEDLADVVALGRRRVGVDRGGVRHVRVGVDQRPRVLRGGHRWEREQEEQDEGERPDQITPSRSSASISAADRPSAPYTSWL